MGLTLQAGTATFKFVRFPFNFLRFFLRESLFCWILDGDLAFATLRQNQQSSHRLTHEESIPPSSLSRANLCDMAEKVRSDFQMLEQKLALDQTYQPSLSLDLHNFNIPSRPSSTTRSCSSAPVSPARHLRRQDIRPDFQKFCDQLLEAQRLRDQEKEIKKLQCTLKASKKSQSRSAFDTFCQEVLLTTELSKKKKEIRQLRDEVEMAKMGTIDMEVKAENQVAQDSQEDRLAEARRAGHERGMQEVVEEWRKENVMLRREIELLKLSQATRSLEQELSNELEDRLFEQQSHYHEWSTDSARSEAAAVDDGYSTDRTDIELEDMTTMSSSSTCVGSPSPSPRKKAIRPSRKAGRNGFVGFSFNPLYYGPGAISSKRRNSTPAPSLASRPPWRG